jgi:hypothetical protein
VDLSKDDWERFEPGVQDTVDKCNVEVEKENNRFKETELEWANETFKKDVLGSSALVRIA